MDIHGIQQGNKAYQKAQTVKPVDKVVKNENTASSSRPENAGAVYEKSPIVEQMKLDVEQRTAQLQDLVKNMMYSQAGISENGNDIWKFLASGKYTVTAEVKQAAQDSIGKDGYWGVDQTSERILSFAKALSGNDPEKADLMLDAFKKGYEKAMGAWGKGLPDISKQTYDAVLQKFDQWKNGGQSPVTNTTIPTSTSTIDTTL